MPIPLILRHQVRIQGIYVGSKAHFEAMNRAIVASRTQPVGDQIYAFDMAREALKCMEKSAHFGKIVIRVVA